MGEIVVNSEELKLRAERNEKKEKEIDERVEETMEEEEENKKKEGDCSNRKRNGLVIRWEKLLPKMALRVLLVEADDSTRQIIAALLRKCSYKVAAVADGLKAWEMLKGRPCNVDLILTEVDLPSISGYALLTLIMEHDICKNIPVIMMSSEDSVSTVYKCMLRGAADYLVKPIRRNELRNLWQHVWRRQSSLARGNGSQEESVGQDKAETTSENNAASNHSSADIASIQNNKKLMEKGSDAQSSCTKPDMEAESAPVETAGELLRPGWGNHALSDVRMQRHDACLDCGQKLPMHESSVELGSAAVASKDHNQTVVDENSEPESRRMNAKVTHETCGNNHVLVQSSREAFDFMGTSGSHKSSLDNTNCKFDFFSQLDPRFTRIHHPNGLEIQVSEKSTLRHSNSSAFTRYSSRPLQPVATKWESIPNQKELGAYSERNFSSNLSGYNSDAPGPPASAERPIISLANGQTNVSDAAISHSQTRAFPIRIPVSGIAYNNNMRSNYNPVCPPVICKQSGASSTSSPSSGSQLEPNCKANPFQLSNLRSNSEHLHDRSVQTEQHDGTFSRQKVEKKLVFLEEQGHNSPATDQSATNSSCNGAATHHNLGYGSTSGSNSNVDQAANTRTTTDRKVEESFLHSTTSSLRSMQREAALTKFRMKRKDRCYEKKVRYESRKKLAEQRPRVKGQFVRQACPPPAETEE